MKLILEGRIKMKIFRDEQKYFKPVTIVLETQEEVNKIFAVANFNDICESLKLHDLYRDLQKFRDDGYYDFHRKLMKIFRQN